MTIFIIAILMLRLFIAIVPQCNTWLHLLWQQITSQLKRKQQSEGIFDEYFIEARAFYLREFKRLPGIAFIGGIDSEKILDVIRTNKYGKVRAIYQRNWYNWQQERIEFSKTIVKLDNQIMIRLSDDWAEILFSNTGFEKANNMLHEFKTMKAPAKEEDYEINIITLNSNGLDLKQLKIKPVALDIDLYYNDDFKAVDQTIKERLAKENDKGIILLHGLPGTGKTTYLRHLIGSMKKKVLFVSPGVAGNLMNPEFIDLLIDNPNAVLVIEDAENIVMDRKYNSGSSVSNLLNISDGLLSDCLNVQIICTFNSALHLIDSALLRKGRLIAKYEFGKLSPVKAVKLSQHLGLNQATDKAMTLAEITHPGDTHYQVPQVQVIGFKRELLEN
jgi:ATPase family associated with various cellular activities (AAA)